MYNNKGNLIISSDNPSKGNLYVGGYDSLNQIQDYKIGAVLSAVWTKFTPTGNVKHLLILADDCPTYDMSVHFDQAVKFIDENLQQTNVLVHCAAGISRSVCLVIAYMIKIHKLDPQTALNKCREKRPWSGPNEGFMKQLHKYYDDMKSKGI